MTNTAQHNRFGSFLKQLRNSRETGMAQAARAAGVNRSTLHRWEKGETLPRLTELEAFLTALEATAQQKKQAIALMDAPRAQAEVRQHINRIAEHLALHSLPHGGDLLRAMRIRKGWTLEETATRVGVSDRTLRRWEQGSVWPRVKQLHALCFVLGAAEEELIALTAGPLRFSGEQPHTGGSIAPDAIEHELDRVRLLTLRGDYHLIELKMLALKQHTWKLAARRDSARHLLGDLYSIHAQYYAYQKNYDEVGRLAAEGFAVLPEKSYRLGQALSLATNTANSVAHRVKNPSPRRAAEMFRPWLSVKCPPDMSAWMHATMAHIVAKTGETETALAFAEKAMEVGSLSSLAYAKAYILAHHANQPSQALAILSGIIEDTPIYRFKASLLRTKILTDLGEISEAHYWLGETLQLSETYCLQADTSEIDALVQRL